VKPKISILQIFIKLLKSEYRNTKEDGRNPWQIKFKNYHPSTKSKEKWVDI